MFKSLLLILVIAFTSPVFAENKNPNDRIKDIFKNKKIEDIQDLQKDLTEKQKEELEKNPESPCPCGYEGTLRNGECLACDNENEE